MLLKDFILIQLSALYYEFLECKSGLYRLVVYCVRLKSSSL